MSTAVAPYLDRAKWLDARMPNLGSTDVGAILGVDEFKTPAQVWDRIVLGTREDADGADIRRGNKQEDIASAAVAEYLGLTLSQVRRHPMRRHAKHKFMVTDVDRMICSLSEWPEALAGMMDPQLGPGALEVKVPRVGTFYQYRDEGLPLRHVLQHQHHFGVTGWRWGVFAFYTPEYDDVIAFPVVRDDEFVDMAMPRLAEWWEEHVVARVRPERPMPKPGRWPSKPAGVCESREDPLWESAAGNYIERYADSERARMHLEVAQQQLTSLMGESDTNVAGAGVKVIRKSTTSQRRWDAEKFRAAVKQAQLEEDTELLMSLDPADDAFYYRTQSKDKVEVKLTKPLPAEEEDAISETEVPV